MILALIRSFWGVGSPTSSASLSFRQVICFPGLCLFSVYFYESLFSGLGLFQGFLAAALDMVPLDSCWVDIPISLRVIAIWPQTLCPVFSVLESSDQGLDLSESRHGGEDCHREAARRLGFLIAWDAGASERQAGAEESHGGCGRAGKGTKVERACLNVPTQLGRCP